MGFCFSYFLFRSVTSLLILPVFSSTLCQFVCLHPGVTSMFPVFLLMLVSLRLFLACVPVFVPRHVLLGPVLCSFFLVFSFACPLLSASHTGFVNQARFLFLTLLPQCLHFVLTFLQYNFHFHCKKQSCWCGICWDLYLTW